MNGLLEKLGNEISVFTSATHKFSTDTVLLSDFSLPVKNKRIIELGAGCGALSLMWFRDNVPSEVLAVEIQRDACQLLDKSVKYNKLDDRLKVVNCDFNDFNEPTLHNTFDIVVCNPPYKPLDTGLLSKKSSSQIKNHEVKCCINDIARFASKYLKYGGKLCMCFRPDRLPDVMQDMRYNHIEPKKIRFVHFTTDKPSKLILIEGRKGGKPYLEILPPLILKNNDLMDSEETKRIYSAIKEVN